MDRVTRNMIHSIPKTRTQREVLGEDGTLYTIETSWEEVYRDHQPEYNESQWGMEDASTNNGEYIITTVTSGSLERKPLTNYRALSATPGRVTETYSPNDGIHRVDLWVPSPDRDSKLELVQKGELYDLRAYKEERKPAKLYSETDEEIEYCMVAVEASPDRLRELEDERKRIIEGQKVKLSPLRQWHSLGELGSEADSPPTSPRKMPETSATEFDRQFGTPESQGASFNQENVDREQINFLAARQQFLMLEQRKPDLLQGLKPQSRPPNTSESKRYVYERDWQRDDGSPYAPTVTAQLSYHPDGSQRGYTGGSKGSSVPSLEDEMVGQQRASIAMEEQDTEKRRTITRQLLVTSSRERRDSGHDEGFGAEYGNDGSPSREVSGNWHVRESGTEPPAMSETPIEKEIRLALEREEELRRERGIQGLASTQEMVAIFKTPLLYRSPPSSPGRKGKENRRGSYFIQREIEMEAKREDDLKSEGKVVRLYDKGPLEEVGERKKRFEQEDEVPVLPIKSIHYKSADLDLYERNPSYKSADLDLYERNPSYKSADLDLYERNSSYKSADLDLYERNSNFVPMEMPEESQAQNVSPEVKRSSRERVSRIPQEAYAPYLTSDSEGGRGQSVPASYKHSSRYTRHPSTDYDLQTPKLDDQTKASEQDSSMTPENAVILQKEYFSWKPWTPKLSPVAMAQDPPDEPPPRLQPDEKALYEEQGFTMKPLRTQTLSLIEREIQEVLQREEELQQQRRMLFQRPSGSLSPDLSSTQPQGSQQQDQGSGSPDRHMVSLFSTPLQPLVLSSTPASDMVLPGASTYQAYSAAPKGPAPPPPEWEPRTQPPEWAPRTQPSEWEPRTQPPEWEPRTQPPEWEHRTQPPEWEPRTQPPEWEPRTQPPEWEPRTPGKLKSWQLEEFERGRRSNSDEHDETRGFQTPEAATGRRGSPDRHVVALFATPFRPLAFKAPQDASWDTNPKQGSSCEAYGVPPLEWEPRNPSRLKDEQLEDFESRPRRQRDEYGESRDFEPPGPVTGHLSLPDRHVVSLFSTSFRPLVVGTASSAPSDTALRREATCQTYSATPKGPAPPPPEWEPRTLGRLKDSQLQEFEDRRSRQRDEYGYAGIDPRDDVNNEIVESTRVSRRKSAMALRWEAGQYLNTQDDDEG